MKKQIIAIAACCLAAATYAQRQETILTDGWRFHRGEASEAKNTDFNDGKWQQVSVPHDWAIYGPFGVSNDLQNVAVTQNGEKEATTKTGRTGGLPWVGIGWYRTTFDAPKSGATTLLFDGAMSEAHVYVNGKEAIFWPYGYNSFHVDVSDLVHRDGTPNTLSVRLENRDESSRWYPGAGLYRNVHVIHTDSIHIPVWGTYITTPHVEKDFASVKLQVEVVGNKGKAVRLDTEILSPEGKVVAKSSKQTVERQGHAFEQTLLVEKPALWSCEKPNLYTAVTKVIVDGKERDVQRTTFGIRSIEYVAHKGFFLNGKNIQFKGVCNHHDLGPLGTAIHVDALRHQLTMLKAMGCNAIRTSHNMPAPELVKLCDEMGLMMMVEPFDEWDVAKCKNGYHRYWKEWAEKDMVNMLHHYRNNPSVVMWSIGNEVPTQGRKEGFKMVDFLQGICHREDPTRPCTCGMDQVGTILKNGFGATVDIPGFNYRDQYYEEGYKTLPQGFILGSETASTVSSRGTYMFPVTLKKQARYENHQSNGYDTEACSWSNVPDLDFWLEDDNQWHLGQFVWTGFDYLGEPSPYDTNDWPSHSSVFGIIDLASLPKDRYYLYQSKWAPEAQTLHILPHWTWPGREGEVTPVFVYTSAPEAELFVNGVSQGRQKKLSKAEAEAIQKTDPLWQQRRYRLMWTDVKYQPGEIKVVAYNADGSVMGEKTVKTAGKPDHLVLTPTNLDEPKANLSDALYYVTVSVVDKDGNPCPNQTDLVQFAVKGAGKFRAAGNGDATNLDLFHQPQHHLFAGQLTAIVQRTSEGGTITLEAKAKGLKSAKLVIE